MPTIVNLDKLERAVHAALADHDLATLRTLLQAQHPADIADIVDRLPEDEQLQVFRQLSVTQAAEVLDETALEPTRDLIMRLTADEVGQLLDRLPPDDVAEILGEDVPERQDVLLQAMAPHEAAEVRTLLLYPPRTAGRLMTERFVRLSPALTAAELMRRLRVVAPDVEAMNDLFVLDDADNLMGVTSLHAALLAPPDQRLLETANRTPITVLPETDQEEVARLVSQYDLGSLPVVTPEGKMLGIVTVDDVIDVLVQEGTEDVLRLGAVEGGGTDENYFSTPLLRTIRRRIGWLMVLFVTGTLTTNVLGRFEETLSRVVALSFFIPLLIGTGGNTGAQTVSTMVRGMALGDIRGRDVGRVLGREMASGLILGGLLGIVALGFALVLGNEVRLAIVVALSVVIVCTWSNMIGALVPLVAQRLKLDPALVSAPMITTLVDATGLAIYLVIAQVLLGL